MNEYEPFYQSFCEMAQLDTLANHWDFTDFMGNIPKLGYDLPGNQTWLAGKSPINGGL
jgi:hypothetical protein